MCNLLPLASHQKLNGAICRKSVLLDTSLVLSSNTSVLDNMSNKGCHKKSVIISFVDQECVQEYPCTHVFEFLIFAEIWQQNKRNRVWWNPSTFVFFLNMYLINLNSKLQHNLWKIYWEELDRMFRIYSWIVHFLVVGTLKSQGTSGCTASCTASIPLLTLALFAT